MDILLVDMELPGLSGVELIALATERQAGLSCLAYTVSGQRDAVFSAIKAGACGYILKGGGFRELVGALQTIQDGGAPMSPGIARQVIQQFQQMAQPSQTAPQDELSAREQDVLRGLAGGQAYKQIANSLSISTHTVNTHVKHIYEKLHVRSREEAVRKARQRGWL
jgi:DNA-binding NarL/FixJ family response regulator